MDLNWGVWLHDASHPHLEHVKDGGAVGEVEYYVGFA